MQAEHSVGRANRSAVGFALATIGAVLMMAGFSPTIATADSVPTQRVPLGNDTAGVEPACPDDEGDYWHFVIAPNNDTFSFVSITLNLGDTTKMFDGGAIIANGTQTDNVFVAVPSGYELTDVVLGGSFADITPASPTVKFVLSHLCVGSLDTTAPTTAAPTTAAPTTAAPTTAAPTTAAPTTAAPTTAAPTTAAPTTAPETTVLVGQAGPTTTAPASTSTAAPTTSPTTTSVEAGPTTTVAATAPTSSVVASAAVTTTVAGVLPATGTENDSLMVAGIVLVMLGGVMLLVGRRPRVA